MEALEIERKFLVKKLPEDLKQYECRQLEQGYLCTEPVVRIRRSDDTYTLTYKGKRSVSTGGIQSATDQRGI